MTTLLRAAVAAALLVLGGVVAVAATAVHELAWGLPLAGTATLLTAYALPAGWWARLPFAVGWAGLVAWLMTPRREGDYVVLSSWRGYALLALALAVAVAAVVTLPRPRRVQPDPRPAAS